VEIGGLYEQQRDSFKSCWVCWPRLLAVSAVLLSSSALFLDHRGARRGPVALAGGAITLWAPGRR